ncbi:hypothetical protein G7Y79_00052g087590 [Physcia stellaris]|nr:hypothetical protein G7Y79_00052g087590 [Physcia stellaris]
MADPITVLQVISASTTLVAQCAQVIKGLYELAGKFKNAELSILSIAHELDIIALAWERIEGVLKSWEGMIETMADSDHDLLARLRRNLAFGDLIVTSLAEDMSTFVKRPVTFGQRSRYVWNEERFRGHLDRIRGQVGAMHLLVSVLNLSSAPERANLLKDGDEILRKSDESAYTIVPSYLSSRIASLYSNPSGLSVDSAELVYRQLTIDDDLFTARVYKRNYRHPFMNLQKRPRPSNALLEGGKSSINTTAGRLPDQQSGHASSASQSFIFGVREDGNPSHPQPSPDISMTPIETCEEIRFLSSPWILGATDNSVIDSDVFDGPARRIELVELLFDNDSTLGSWLLTQSDVSFEQFWSTKVVAILYTQTPRTYGKDAKIREILHLACLKGQNEIVKCLLPHSSVSRRRERKLLSAAAYNFHPETVELLLEHGFGINSDHVLTQEILKLAYSEGQVEINQSLRPYYDGLAPPGSELLLAAAYNFLPKTVELLLEQGCDINVTHGYGESLLVNIVRGWSKASVAIDVARALQILNTLLRNGADITERTCFGNNIYHLAATGKRILSAETLDAIQVGWIPLSTALCAQNSVEKTPRDIAEAHANKEFLTFQDNTERFGPWGLNAKFDNERKRRVGSSLSLNDSERKSQWIVDTNSRLVRRPVSYAS